MSVLQKSGALAAIVAAVALAVTASPALAVTITPANTAYTADASGGGNAITFQVGTTNITCAQSNITGKTTNPADNNNVVSGPGGVTFAMCKTNIIGATVVVTTAGNWTLTAVTPTTGTITIPASGATALVTTLVVTCNLDITAGGAPQSIPYTWSNMTRRLTLNTAVAFKSNGFPCPASGNATVTGSYVFPAGISIT